MSWISLAACADSAGSLNIRQSVMIVILSGAERRQENAESFVDVDLGNVAAREWTLALAGSRQADRTLVINPAVESM